MKKNIDFISYYKDKKILITGGAGNIGSLVVDVLSDIPCKIIVLDVEGASLYQSDEKSADISLKYCDIRDKDIWSKYVTDVDIIFHFAAQTSSYVANEDPVKDLEVNLFPIASFIEECNKTGSRPDILFSGTVTQVGLTTEPATINEDHRDLPVTVYDINKLAAEKYLQYYSKQMGGRSVVLRLANVYGPGPASSSSDRGILNKMVKKALSCEPLTIYGDGTFIRDYIFIGDVVKAFLLAGANMDVVNGEYFVVGSGKGHSIKDMITFVRDEVCRRTGNKSQINHIDPPSILSQIEYRNFVADTSSLNSKIGWKADVLLIEGINKTIDFFIQERNL